MSAQRRPLVSIFRFFMMGMLYLCLFTFSSCVPEEEPFNSPYAQDGPGLLLKLELEFEGEDAVLFHDYGNVLGQQMQFETIKFYLTDIRLVETDGDELDLSAIEIFDVTGENVEKAYDVPVGSYSGIRFNVGVPQYLNGTANPDFETFIYQNGHPLASNYGMYWAWQTGYRFFIYDGRLDTVGSAPLDIPTPFSIHMGTDTTLLSLSFDQAFEISGNDRHIAHFTIDLAHCMYNATDTLHLSDPFESNFHGGSNIELALRFKELLKDAIDVQVD